MSFTGTGYQGQEARKTRFPQLHSYVTIKLDPVKSVEILEDDEATSAAHDIVGKVYIGYIGSVSIFISIQMQTMTHPLSVRNLRLDEPHGRGRQQGPLFNPSPTVWSP